ncbi:hypothetical protein [Luteitalea sp.]|uniref:hypothetical protein n=1 Tax=Luteitalea sp. TaxID=2004800 RepID=UPI0025C2C90D|nr:hypothetical protein [Luteitalea sp.]
MRPLPSSRILAGATPAVARPDTMQAISQHGYGSWIQPLVFRADGYPPRHMASGACGTGHRREARARLCLLR